MTESLDSAQVNAILEGRGLSGDANDELVIQRVEYYLHHKVWVLDYAEPNAYLPREAWEAQVANRSRERQGENQLWKEIRGRAYTSAEETTINTHPIAYIGGDNKGLDQLLAPVGGRNQDSHATYPFPGLYKTIGPQGTGEQVSHTFDHWVWYQNRPPEGALTQTTNRGGDVVLYNTADLVDVVPDWERVLPLVRRYPDARREWSWLVLPVHWGYPASPSPFAGMIPHADMGNVGPIGPAYNDGWNRPGPGRGFALYEPNRLPAYFPVEAQDRFSNKLGFLNIIPLIGGLPPFDLIWGLVALPFRAVLKENHPIYFPEESVPDRFIGLTGGAARTSLPEEMAVTVFHVGKDNTVGDPPVPIQVLEILVDLTTIDADALQTGSISETFADPSWGWFLEGTFYLGERLVTSTGVRNTRHSVGFRHSVSTRPEPYAFEAKLNMWDLAGNVRYNMLTGALKPYLKVGYGVNWYRLEDMLSDGNPMEAATGPWINNFWPLTWQYGGGIEFMMLHGSSGIGHGIDVGLLADWRWFNGPTGIDLPGGLPLETAGSVPKRWTRGTFNLGLSVSY